MIKDRKLKQQRYQPEFACKKPKSTSGGQYVVKSTGEEYKGMYFETSTGKYYSGTKPTENGVELEKLTANHWEDLMPLALAIPGLLRGLFKPKPKKGDSAKGVTKRYFIRNNRTSKIIEVDKPTYDQANRELPNHTFAAVDWIIKGPAEDKVINGYPYEGAVSRNRKTIQALEKQIPGISTFITDYALLVEEPIPLNVNQLSSTTTTIQDKDTVLENSRKANFDLRK